MGGHCLSDLWDYGETGAVVNYNMTANHTRSRIYDSQTSNFYANLSGHFNFGTWRLYTSGSFTAENFSIDTKARTLITGICGTPI